MTSRNRREDTQGEKLPELYRLSNERCLYLRLTSPHESVRIHCHGRPQKQGTDEFSEKDGWDNRGEHTATGTAVELHRSISAHRSAHQTTVQ